MFILLLIIAEGLWALDLKCASTNKDEKFSRGDSMVICLHFIDPISNIFKRLSFEVKVDRYTAIYAKNAYEKVSGLTKNNVTIALQANKNTQTSAQIPYLINGVNAVPVYSAVVQMDGGNVTDIVWDNGCWDGGSKCLEGYGIEGDRVNYIEGCQVKTDCDPKVYVSFIGTDSESNYMESAGRRISRFRQYAVNDMYQSAKSLFSGYANDAQNAVK